MLAGAERQRTEAAVVFLGDPVGWGAKPGPVMRRPIEASVAVPGDDQDWAVKELLDLEWLGQVARVAIEWTAEYLRPDYLRQLAELPPVATVAEAILAHASPHEPTTWPNLSEGRRRPAPGQLAGP